MIHADLFRIPRLIIHKIHAVITCRSANCQSLQRSCFNSLEFPIRLTLPASFSTVTLTLLTHVTMQAHRHFKLAQALNWFIELEFAPVDVEALALQRIRNIRRSDRSKQMIFLADLTVEAQRGTVQLLGQASAAVFSTAVFRTADCFICSITARFAAVASIASLCGSR